MKKAKGKSHLATQRVRVFKKSEKKFEVLVEKPAQGGDSMAHLPDGRVCFIKGALPDEIVQITLTKNAKDFALAKVEKIIQAHPQRVIPRCPLFYRCGGCSMQHASFSLQTDMLKKAVCDTFFRFVKKELPQNFSLKTGNPFEYRNRARLVSEKNAPFGFRASESHRVIPISNCPVLTPTLNEFLNSETARKINRQLAGREELEIFDNASGRENSVAYYYSGMSAVDFEKYANTTVYVSGKEISTDASVFFQSNLSLLPELVHSVQRLVGSGKHLIDLFSGVGFFAAQLQENFERVTAVERDANCLRHAKCNLKSTVEFIASPVEEWLLGNTDFSQATLLVDPPRTGLPPSVLQAFIKSSLERIIYVSCNPVTFARDTAMLAQGGFSVTSSEGFAFYPQTPHLEMLSVLER